MNYEVLEALRQICVVLARMEYNFKDKRANGEPYFKIDQSFPTERLNYLIRTYCPMESEAIYRAAVEICDFYKDIAPRMAIRHHLKYHTELEKMFIGQLIELSN